jgi:hypothetical protein
MPETGWTLSTLKAVVDGEIAALGRVTDARFVAGDASAAESKEAIKVGLAAAQTALAAAAALAKEAVTEAKAAHAAEHAALAMALSLAMLELKERLVEMNNFRKQIADERGDFVTRDRLAQSVEGVNAIVSAAVVTLTTQLQILESTSSAWQKAQDVRLGQIERVVQTPESQRATEVRISHLETSRANLEGRLWALGVGLTILMFAVNFVFNNVIK